MKHFQTRLFNILCFNYINPNVPILGANIQQKWQIFGSAISGEEIWYREEKGVKQV